MGTTDVTLLFTDVVGSTQLAQSMPADAADSLRRSIFSSMRASIHDCSGREVKNLGDGLMAVFSSAAEALACAVAIQQAIEFDNRRRTWQVAVRVGVSAGAVTVEDDDYFGDPVIEAARLCGVCDGGQILAAMVVRLMAGRRTDHQYRPVGALVLKGLIEPVEVVQVLWDPLPDTASGVVPLPRALTATPAGSLVGRAAQLGDARAAFGRVAGGDGREVWLVSGEPGIGKTTLLSAVSQFAHDRGATVLFGHCEEDLVAPYQLFRESLAHLVQHAPQLLADAQVQPHAGVLSVLVPALSDRVAAHPPTVDAGSEQFVLYSAVASLLAVASAERPVVLVFDDLQWADTASVGLLRHLVSSAAITNVLVVGSFRDHEVAQAPALLDALAHFRRLSGVRRTDLPGLADDDVVDLLRERAGHDLDPASREWALMIRREADGNPFFVGELVRHLVDNGALARNETGRWGAGEVAVQLPDSVREVVSARVARLGDAVERALAMAAVIGRDFDAALLARALDTPYDDMLDLLDIAVGAALVTVGDGSTATYSFSHALIQHTLYERPAPPRRARLHRRLAVALEERHEGRTTLPAQELARHWSATGDVADAAKAVAYNLLAAHAALDALAPSEAVRHYAVAKAHAADLVESDPGMLLDLDIGLGVAQRQAGDAAFRQTLIDAARRAIACDDTPRLFAATLANDRGWVSAVGALDTDKVEILEALLDRLRPEEPARARVLAALCAELTYGGSLERRQLLADEARVIALASNDDATIIGVSNHLSFALQFPSLLAESFGHTADALARSERLGDPVLRFHAAVSHAADAARAADVDALDASLAIGWQIAHQLGHPALTWNANFNASWRHSIAGDLDAAEQAAQRALEIGIQTGQPDAAVFFGVQRYSQAYMRGTIASLLPQFEATAAANPGLTGFSAKLALAYAASHRAADALEILQLTASNGFSTPSNVSWASTMADYAEATILCGHQPFADALIAQLGPYHEQVVTTGGVGVAGPVSYFIGALAALAGRFDDADRWLAEASAINERLAAKYFGARTDLWWGSSYVVRGNHDRARALLGSALDAATAEGYGDLRHRALDRLAEL